MQAHQVSKPHTTHTHIISRTTVGPYSLVHGAYVSARTSFPGQYYCCLHNRTCSESTQQYTSGSKQREVQRHFWVFESRGLLSHSVLPNSVDGIRFARKISIKSIGQLKRILWIHPEVVESLYGYRKFELCVNGCISTLLPYCDAKTFNRSISNSSKTCMGTGNLNYILVVVRLYYYCVAKIIPWIHLESKESLSRHRKFELCQWWYFSTTDVP